MQKQVQMRKKKSITLSSKPTYQGYSHGFKIAIIERIENGQLSIRQAAKEYDVSSSGIRKWIKKYGNLDEAEKKVMIWETTMEIIEDEFQVYVKKVSNQIPETCLKKYGQKIGVTDLKRVKWGLKDSTNSLQQNTLHHGFV